MSQSASASTILGETLGSGTPWGDDYEDNAPNASDSLAGSVVDDFVGLGQGLGPSLSPDPSVDVSQDPVIIGTSSLGAGLGPDLTSEADSAPSWKPSVDASQYNPVAKDTVNVAILPEMEGMFMFRYVVYVVDGTIPAAGTAKAITDFRAIRRYSDFLWLLECLTRIYPFRLLPMLPPKRLTLDGKYLSSDTHFLDRRRRGLHRFVNQLIKHPVLRHEKLVLTFLTVDTDLTAWRKQSSFHLDEEFAHKPVSRAFVSKWAAERGSALQRWQEMRQGVEQAFGAVSQLCHLVDRMCKRNEAMAQDYSKLSFGLTTLRTAMAAAYPESGEAVDTRAISDAVAAAGRYAANADTLLRDQAASNDIGVLEDLKTLRDLIGAVRELFLRWDRLGANTIGQLEQRIDQNRRRLATLESRVETKPTELARVRQSIEKDRQSIEAQTVREWHIRECLTEELQLCQRTQYQVSKTLREWSLENIKYAELLSDNWADLDRDLGDMP